MYKSEVQVRVRYGETDQMGYVYYGHFASYYEVARVESFRSLGITYKEIEELGVIMPVLENWSKYIAPALYDDLLTVKTEIREMPMTRVKFHYEIYNQDDTLINLGETRLVFLDSKTRKPVTIPPAIHEKLDPFFNA